MGWKRTKQVGSARDGQQAFAAYLSVIHAQHAILSAADKVFVQRAPDRTGNLPLRPDHGLYRLFFLCLNFQLRKRGKFGMVLDTLFLLSLSLSLSLSFWYACTHVYIYI